MKVTIVLSVMVVFAAASALPQPWQPALASIPIYSSGGRFVRAAPFADLQADSSRVERQAGGEHHHDVADFGAHTGHHGAFGWYADFPVHTHGH